MGFFFIDTVLDGLQAGFMGLKNIAVVVLPLMVAVELAKDSGLMEWATGKLQSLAVLLQISKESLLPLVVGLFAGLAFGSGILINASKEAQLSKKDRYIVAVFLSLCHSVFEDTLLLTAVGASLPWLLGSRILLAVIGSMLAARFFPEPALGVQNKPAEQGRV
ncbi:MAG TPA: nucleoside recognition protein [Firmicutes bacterium]|nr:nucleoside recognition protein [Bacillota bacterium]